MTLTGIPIRSFAGMSRLAPVLTPDARGRLARVLAGRAVRAARGAAGRVAVVTGDPAVARWAHEEEIDVIDDPGDGLDAAASAVVDMAAGGPWLVLHADLPAVTATDIAAMRSAGETAIAPSRDGGTAAISGRGAFAFAYGPGSFLRHLAAAGPGARVVVRPGLAFDVDRPEDLRAAVALGLIPDLRR